MRRTVPELIARIDPEFENHIPPHDELTKARLRESIADRGIRDAITMWKEADLVVDGHNRLREAHSILTTTRSRKLKELVGSVPVVYESFGKPGPKNRERVKEWMFDNELSHRERGAGWTKYLAGSLYNRRKGVRGGDQMSDTVNVAEELGRKFGKSASTIKAWGAYAEFCDKVRVLLPTLKEQWELIGCDFPADVLEDILGAEDPAQAIAQAKQGKKIKNLEAARKRQRTLQQGSHDDLPDSLNQLPAMERRSLANGLKLLRQLVALTEHDQFHQAVETAVAQLEKPLPAPLARDLTKLGELCKRLDEAFEDLLYHGDYPGHKLAGGEATHRAADE